MSRDLGPLLAGWPYEPHEMAVRIVAADDGTPALQVRVELGVLQLRLAGRPDGQRPRGAESLLDALEADAARGDDHFRLEGRDLDELDREAQQYYKRYVALFHLEDFHAVARDTERNLRLLEFVRRHARRKKDVWRFDQHRPYLLMMAARARGELARRDGRLAAAVQAAERGCQGLRAFLAEYGRSPEDTQCGELEFLVRWRRELQLAADDAPDGELAGLQRRLADAVAREDYEGAAALRDRIRTLEAPAAPS
jgi:hypothetical protein